MASSFYFSVANLSRLPGFYWEARAKCDILTSHTSFSVLIGKPGSEPVSTSLLHHNSPFGKKKSKTAGKPESHTGVCTLHTTTGNLGNLASSVCRMCISHTRRAERSPSTFANAERAKDREPHAQAQKVPFQGSDTFEAVFSSLPWFPASTADASKCEPRHPRRIRPGFLQG